MASVRYFCLPQTEVNDATNQQDLAQALQAVPSLRKLDPAAKPVYHPTCQRLDKIADKRKFLWL
jgi:hypothetical protein